VNAKRALTRFRVPDERAAEDRAWQTVRSAYQSRVPVAHRRSYRRPVGGAAAGLVLVGALALSPAGATVGHLITRALGVEHASPALSSLPAPGRLLLSGRGGTWTVASDGSTRRVGPWQHASWSPHGLYVTVTAANRLEAVSPRGVPQWTLGRGQVSDPRWFGPSGYRVAYLSGHELRAVAGDGSGDHLVAARVAAVAPAWRPGHAYQLAYVGARGSLVVRDADTGAELWSARPGVRVRELQWSADGRRLLAVSAREVRMYTGSGTLVSTLAAAGDAPVLDGALSPSGSKLALVSGGVGGGVVVENAQARHPSARRVLAGSGLGQVAWSPNGRWLLVSWPAANQWVFVRVAGAPRIFAVSRIAQQFSAGGRSDFPQLEGWCCSAGQAR
jgi:hypothetical protein